MANNEEEFKKMIEDMFQQSNKSPKDQKAEQVFKDIIGQTDEELTDEAIINVTTGKAAEELEQLQEAFLHFQEAIADLAIMPYLSAAIEQFADQCQSLYELLQEELTLDNLSDEGREKFNELQKLKARILIAIYRKYKK